MNEKIREFAEQSVGCRPYDSFDYEKFAELIVRECIERGNVLVKHYINNHSEQEQVFLLAAIADYSSEIEKNISE
jgi:hypothetical protein